MFIWSLASILDAFEIHLPEVHEAFKGLADSYHTDKEQSAIDVIYPACEEVSIDYGIMEKASNVYTMRADIGWSDLGTWGSIYTHLDRDEDGNATVGERVIIKNCKDTLIQSIPGKTVVAEGLDDFIVVDTPESLLIIRKSEEQEIKPLRAEVGKRFDDDLI
jgi:mannose-1-phosphate guanylyltransferase